MENLQKTSKKTPALVWLFAYKSKIAKKNISTLKSKQLSLQNKKIPPKIFVDCAKKKKTKCASPLQNKQKLD